MASCEPFESVDPDWVSLMSELAVTRAVGSQFEVLVGTKVLEIGGSTGAADVAETCSGYGDVSTAVVCIVIGTELASGCVTVPSSPLGAEEDTTFVGSSVLAEETSSLLDKVSRVVVAPINEDGVAFETY